MSQRERILVIEDDAAVARGLLDALDHAGYSAIWRSTGGEGLAFARQHRPQLVILDLRLPDGSGHDVCRRMRQEGLTQPILILTVQDDETDKVLGLEMGADDYVTKPFSLRVLLSRIRALLRRAYGELSSAQGDVIAVDDLVIDLGRGQVWRGDDLVDLTPTELRLLVHLARHKGQALSRAQLLDGVWGYEADVESERTVNVHIHRLREKIELDPARPSLILTVPGIGYRLAG